jgi:hypothetical protein
MCRVWPWAGSVWLLWAGAACSASSEHEPVELGAAQGMGNASDDTGDDITQASAGNGAQSSQDGRTAAAGTGGAGNAEPSEQSQQPSQPAAAPQDSGDQEADAGMAAQPPNNTADGDCVVAMRLDTCCSVGAAATPAEIAADECLVPWRERYQVDPAQANDCLARSPVNCAAESCMPPKPLSRRVGPDASAACAFRVDCEQDADCQLPSEATHCCACLEAWPASEVESDECVFQEGDVPPDDVVELCSQVCTGFCGACWEPTAPRCTVQEGVRACR